MTFMDLARTLALQEAKALRGWARAGRPVPRHAPIDLWAEWERRERTAVCDGREAA